MSEDYRCPKHRRVASDRERLVTSLLLIFCGGGVVAAGFHMEWGLLDFLLLLCGTVLVAAGLATLLPGRRR